MLEETSIVRQLQRDRAFSPPYCPNSNCVHHQNPPENFWYRHGSKKLQRFPYLALKFACKGCRKVFSKSYFEIYYRQKRWDGNREILRLHRIGASKRETAREIQSSERMVRRRQIRMASWGLLTQAWITRGLKIEEEIVYDGLENFSFSQYEPNNLNHAVGKRSLFTYDFNCCPINRKGRMSQAQVNRKNMLDAKHGRFPKDSIRTSTRSIFERLFAKAPKLVLYTDRHFQYRRVLELDMPEKKIEHVMTSSKVYRNFKNPLFAVNNIDMQARHNLAAFKRETIAFSKNIIAMQESFVLYMIHRNFMRPKFWGTHRSDPECSKKSPAMELGLTDKILSFDDFFRIRVPRTHVDLNEDWERLYRHLDPFARRKIV